MKESYAILPTKLPVARNSWCTTLRASLLLGACALIGASSTFGQVVIKDSHLKVNGIAYFRGNAENVQLGSYGDKKTPVTAMNYLSVDGTIPRENLGKVQKPLVFTIDASKTSKTELFGSGSDVAGLFGCSGEAAWEKVKSQQLKLVKFVIDNEHVTKAGNQSSKALKSLKDRGNGARIASQVFVVLSAEMAEAFKNSASIDASATDGKIKLTASGTHSSSGSTSVTLSKGSTFAYGLVKLDWKKGKIESVEDDKWSLN
jgi:hypothetical protein